MSVAAGPSAPKPWLNNAEGNDYPIDAADTDSVDFSDHGFKHATALGEVAVDVAIDGTTEIPVQAFSLDRFGPTPTRIRG